jgi:hypothetical protein
MPALGLVVAVIILAIDAVISIWNSYTAGKVSTVSRGLGVLFYVLGGLVPMAYVTSIVIATLLAVFRLVNYTIVNLLLSFDFVFFGAVLILWGVIATVATVLTAVRTRDWRAGLVSAYNIGALFYDTWDYLTNITSAVGDFVKDLASDRDKDSAVLVLVVATAIALAVGFIITYAAYRAGRGSG